MKPEARPLFILIDPYGIFVQFCPGCKHGLFMPVDDNTHMACEKCGLRMALFDPKRTAQLEHVNLEKMH
jgi:DNA-directed RNA polymerase subunit M/transcription elongation factor TFIIS